MGFDTGRVVLDKNDLTYTAGQVVSGKLEFKQDKVKTFRGIHVTAKGFCTNHWTTSHSRRVNGRNETYRVSHDAHEEYFENRMYLIGGKTGECQLKPGQYSFPFQTILPPNCPSSFEGDYGHIRYELKFVVDRAMKIDQEKKIRITVIALKDLNMDPYCRASIALRCSFHEPMMFEFNEVVHSCCCFSMGMYEVVAKVPQSGFCPGQIIPIDVKCTNNSKVNIKYIKFELKESITYRATDDTKRSSKTISKLKKSSVPSNTSRQWTLEMLVPQMDLANVAACRWIDIDYEFKITVSPEGCHSNSDASKGVVLGHIPLRDLDDPNQMALQQAGIQQSPNMYPPPYHAVTNTYPDVGTGYAAANPPYPNEKSPQATSPYPGSNLSYLGGNPPYPGGNTSYPSGTSPYPTGSPYPSADSPNPDVSPYPGVTPPYPSVIPYPMPGPHVEFPVPGPHIGFPTPSNDAQHGQMPYPPPTNPFASASAPEPATPDYLGKNPMP